MTSTAFIDEAWALIALDFKTVSGGKGADTANSQRQQELAMQQKAFDTQQKQLAVLQKAFTPFLSGQQGYSPEALAAMRSQFLNSNNSTFNQAGQQVREALGARGEMGANPVGGNYAAGLSGLLGAKAGSQSQGLLGIQMQNAMQQLQNQFNAGNILSGNAATLTGTQGVAGAGASSALQGYLQAKNTGFASSFMNSFGGTLGKGLGAGLTGGLGALGAQYGGGFGSGFQSGVNG
jgi:hypothetical protein